MVCPCNTSLRTGSSPPREMWESSRSGRHPSLKGRLTEESQLQFKVALLFIFHEWKQLLAFSKYSSICQLSAWFDWKFIAAPETITAITPIWWSTNIISNSPKVKQETHTHTHMVCELRPLATALASTCHIKHEETEILAQIFTH